MVEPEDSGVGLIPRRARPEPDDPVQTPPAGRGWLGGGAGTPGWPGEAPAPGRTHAAGVDVPPPGSPGWRQQQQQQQTAEAFAGAPAGRPPSNAGRLTAKQVAGSAGLFAAASFPDEDLSAEPRVRIEKTGTAIDLKEPVINDIDIQSTVRAAHAPGASGASAATNLPGPPMPPIRRPPDIGAPAAFATVPSHGLPAALLQLLQTPASAAAATGGDPPPFKRQRLEGGGGRLGGLQTGSFSGTPASQTGRRPLTASVLGAAPPLPAQQDVDFSPQREQSPGASSSGERSNGEHEGRGRRQRRRRHRSSSRRSSRERSSSSGEDSSSKRDWSQRRAHDFTGALHGQQRRPFAVPSNAQCGSADDILPHLNEWIAKHPEKMQRHGLDSSPLAPEDLRTVRRLVDCCYDLLPPDHQAQLVQRHGSEEEARAWVADGVQETIILASRAALCATHGHLAWLQGAHAVLPLGSLSAGAQAAAAAVTGQQRRLLQLVGQVLELVLVPAAELCAGQKVDHASNNGVLLYPGGNVADSMHRDGSEGPRLVDSVTVIPRTDAPPDSYLALGTNQAWGSCKWLISGSLVMSSRIRTQDSAKFAHARVSNGQLDMTLRFTFEAGSQADPPPQLPGLLELLQELALYLLDPVAKAELRNPQTWEPTAMGGGDSTAFARAAQRAQQAAAADSPRAARPRHVDLGLAMKERAAMGIASKRDLRGHFGETALYAWSGMGLPAGQQGDPTRVFLVPTGDTDAAALHPLLVAADSGMDEGQLAAFGSAPAPVQRQLALQLALQRLQRARQAAAADSPRAAFAGLEAAAQQAGFFNPDNAKALADGRKLGGLEKAASFQVRRQQASIQLLGAAGAAAAEERAQQAFDDAQRAARQWTVGRCNFLFPDGTRCRHKVGNASERCHAQHIVVRCPPAQQQQQQQQQQAAALALHQQAAAMALHQQAAAVAAGAGPSSVFAQVTPQQGAGTSAAAALQPSAMAMSPALQQGMPVMGTPNAAQMAAAWQQQTMAMQAAAVAAAASGSLPGAVPAALPFPMPAGAMMPPHMAVAMAGMRMGMMAAPAGMVPSGIEGSFALYQQQQQQQQQMQAAAVALALQQQAAAVGQWHAAQLTQQWQAQQWPSTAAAPAAGERPTKQQRR